MFLHFTRLNGLSDEWIESRTGIQQRRKAAEGENSHSMGIEAVQALLHKTQLNVQTIDLIVGATYTPHDTIVTLAHAVQHFVQVPDIPVVTISSACSSLLNAVEIVQGYFAMNKATTALVVTSEHNTGYYNESDTVSGHLWGDGAAALLLTKERLHENDIEVQQILTGGAATSGKATEAVVLKPLERGVIMPYGRDVFQNACIYMPKAVQQVLAQANLTANDVDFVVPHQANLRISVNVMGTLGLPLEKLISNIQYLGNTGCAGCAIALSEHWQNFQKGQRIVITVFGGGYSFGAMLLQV
jgi:3-oxoacyl-[acyl-carrier-protein] synthase III